MTVAVDREPGTVTVSGSGVIHAVLHRSPGTPPRTDVPIGTRDAERLVLDIGGRCGQVDPAVRTASPPPSVIGTVSDLLK